MGREAGVEPAPEEPQSPVLTVTLQSPFLTSEIFLDIGKPNSLFGFFRTILFLSILNKTEPDNLSFLRTANGKTKRFLQSNVMK